MTRIRAAVCHEFGAPLRIEEVDLRPPQGREIEIEIGAVAICHSDISLADGGWGGTLPAIFGHEAAGRVTALGAPSPTLAVGDSVIVTLIRSCGGCRSCAVGRPVLCEAPPEIAGPLAAPDGSAIRQGLACGAFAERVVVDRSQVVPIPSEIPLEAACLLSCGVITGVGAVVNTAGVRPGQDVVVIGAGGVGLNAIQGARIAGARRIIAVDRLEEKLAVAREFGATEGVLADEAPWKAVARDHRAGRRCGPGDRRRDRGLPDSAALSRAGRPAGDGGDAPLGRDDERRASDPRGVGPAPVGVTDGRHGAGRATSRGSSTSTAGAAEARRAGLGALAARPDQRGDRRHPLGRRPPQRDRAVTP